MPMQPALRVVLLCALLIFFGPGVERSLLGLNAFRSVLAGKPVSWLGNPQLPHTMTFIDDFALALVNVSDASACFGEVWHAPSAEALSLRAMVALIAQECASVTQLRPAPRWLFGLMGWFSSNVQELDEVYYQYAQPWVLDSRKYYSALMMPPTSPVIAIRRTLNPLRSPATNIPAGDR